MPSDSESTVFVIDDDELARRSVCALVESMACRARAFASAEEFLAADPGDGISCVVADVRMRGMSGLELQDELQKRGWDFPVVIITGFARTPLTVQAMQKGAVTLLEKPCDEQELWDAIRKALESHRGLRSEQAKRADARRCFSQLTNDEKRVLQLIIEGKPNKTIAYAMDVTTRTIETRRRNIFRKMGAESVAELVRVCVEAGLRDELE